MCQLFWRNARHYRTALGSQMKQLLESQGLAMTTSRESSITVINESMHSSFEHFLLRMESQIIFMDQQEVEDTIGFCRLDLLKIINWKLLCLWKASSPESTGTANTAGDHFLRYHFKSLLLVKPRNNQTRRFTRAD